MVRAAASSTSTHRPFCARAATPRRMVGATTAALVLVAIDDTATGAEVARFAADLGVTVPVYLARTSTVSDRYWRWGVPVSYLVDPAGGFVGRALGPRAWNAPASIAALRAIE